MRDNYDFSDAVKNPFAGKLKGKYKATVHYDFTQDDNNGDDSNKSAQDQRDQKQA